jgi:hypothetical protein
VDILSCEKVAQRDKSDANDEVYDPFTREKRNEVTEE